VNVVTKLIKGGAWLSMSSILSKIASALTLPALARLLGPELLGIYSIVFSLLQSAQSFSSLGVDVSIQRNGAQFDTIGGRAVGRLFSVGFVLIVVVNTVTAVGVFVFRQPLAHHWLGQSEVASWLAITAIIVFLQPLGNVPLLFLSGIQEFRAYAINSTLSVLVSSLLAVSLSYWFGLLGALLGIVVSSALQIIWSYLLVKPVLSSRGIILGLDRFYQELVSILKFGFPYYFGNTLLGSVAGLPLMGLVSQYGGLEELGYLRVAQSIASLVSFIPAAIAPAAISYLSSTSAINEVSEEHSYLKLTHLRAVWFLLITSISISCLVLPHIINFFYGSDYQQTKLLSFIYLWISLGTGIVSIAVQYLLVKGMTFRIAAASTLGILFSTCSAFALIPRYNALGFLATQAIGCGTGFCIIVAPAIAGIDKTGLIILGKLALATVVMFVMTSFYTFCKFEYSFFYAALCILSCLCIVVLSIQMLMPDEKHKVLVFVKSKMES
jgi:O-antigen/teichoic acid export membrane protein